MVATHHLNAPFPHELPALKPDTFFSKTQWQVFWSLVDAVVPSIVVDSEATDQQNQLCISEAQCQEAYERTRQAMKDPPTYDKFKAYLKSRPLDNPRFVESIKRSLSGVAIADQTKLGAILMIMGTRLGSLAATSHFLPVQDQPLHARETILRSWNNTWTNIWPTIGGSIGRIAKNCFSQTDPLFRELNGYRDCNDDYRPGPGYEYEFMQFPPGSDPATVDTDVVIVGSGCGGGVCAKVLAEAGHRVIVVDKGYYFPPSELPMAAEAAYEYLIENKVPIGTIDGSTMLIAGSCWGGGGTINWSASIQPQGFVRQEWTDRGLTFFNTQEFQQSLDRVCDFMQVTDNDIRQNHSNRVILEGARKLGWDAHVVPQNTGGDAIQEHNCGARCTFGCGSAAKKGPAVTWLPAAAKAGARFIEGMDVSKVLFNGAGQGWFGKQADAVGVVGEWLSRDKGGRVHTPESERVRRTIEIRAKKVIISGGTLNSPLLLMRSGLKNPQIGKNLHLHPVGYVAATFEEDVKGWEGSMLTSVCTSFENLDGKGHGVKLEACCMLPHLVMYEHPWSDALQWRLDALRYKQMTSYIALARDRDTGRVTSDPIDGRPRIEYSPSAFDKKSIMTGMIALAKICYIQGATEIWPKIQGVPSFVPKRRREGAPKSDDIDQGVNDPEFVAWLDMVEKTGLNFPKLTFGNAHQMSTCRMSVGPKDGVVDPKGKVWGTENLYVADASVFPSATGVNPMVTTMGIADWIATGVSRELQAERLSASL